MSGWPGAGLHAVAVVIHGGCWLAARHNLPPGTLLGGPADEVPERYAERARAAGDDARLWPVEAAGHFDLVAPFAPAWATVERAVMDLLAVP